MAETILNALECPASELAITIVGDRRIRMLNRQYLGKDRPTNVISFALNEGECSGLNPDVLGDVVISAATAAREAAEGELSFVERLSFLLLHGIHELISKLNRNICSCYFTRFQLRINKPACIGVFYGD